MRRLLPALGLFLLSPLVAEFLLGNLAITSLPTLVVLAPLYGGGALLIREAVRRAGRGWPSILVLALAYGALEEGIATMSLFNPNYAGLRLLDNGYVAALGIGVPWTVLVLTLHVVWSISVPVAIVEVLASGQRTTPWLGRWGLALTVLLFLFGFAATTVISVFTSSFVATMPQLALSALVGVALVAIGLIVLPPAAPIQPAAVGRPPSPWLVGVAALMVSSGFKILPLEWPAWLYVGVVLGLAVLSIGFVWAWSQREGWGDAHRLALAAGPLLTYAWTAFPQPPVLPADPKADLIGNVVFAVAAVVLIGVAALRLRHPDQDDRAATEPASDRHRRDPLHVG